MAEPRWAFDNRPGVRRYRDLVTGRYVSEARLLALRDGWVERRTADVRRLTRRMIEGDVTLAAWEVEMREVVRLAHGAEYLLGRGGANAMTKRDWTRLGKLVTSQQEYLHRFSESLAAGELSPAQALQRASMYPGSAFVSFERGHSEAYGMPRLPVYPGDGGTPCLTNCRCHWSIRESRRRWVATWRLGAAEHCRGCLRRRDRYREYTVAKPGSGRGAEGPPRLLAIS